MWFLLNAPQQTTQNGALFTCGWSTCGAFWHGCLKTIFIVLYCWPIRRVVRSWTLSYCPWDTYAQTYLICERLHSEINTQGQCRWCQIRASATVAGQLQWIYSTVPSWDRFWRNKWVLLNKEYWCWYYIVRLKIEKI